MKNNLSIGLPFQHVDRGLLQRPQMPLSLRILKISAAQSANPFFLGNEKSKWILEFLGFTPNGIPVDNSQLAQTKQVDQQKRLLMSKSFKR